MSVNMNEFFALPVGNEDVKNSLGLNIYTNGNLKNKIIETAYKTDKTKKIAKNIEHMIDKDLLVPVWLNKNIASTLLYKITGPNEKEKIKKTAYAFYSGTDDKIFLFVDNAMSFGFTNNEFLMDLIVHETMHLGVSKLGHKYLKLFSSELESYYNSLFRNLFDVDVSYKLDVKSILEWIFKNFEAKKSLSSRVLYSYGDFIKSKVSGGTNLNEQDLEEKIKNFIITIFLAIQGRFGDIVKESKFREASIAARQAYSDAFKISVPTNNFYIQELFVCSEVIAMLSESKTTESMYSLFKILGS